MMKSTRYDFDSPTGRTTDESQQTSDTLNFVTLKVVDESPCSSVYSNFQSDSQICVESVEYKSTCNG